MSTLGNSIAGLAVALPLVAFVAGSLGVASEDSQPRESIVIESDPSPVAEDRVDDGAAPNTDGNNAFGVDRDDDDGRAPDGTRQSGDEDRDNDRDTDRSRGDDTGRDSDNDDSGDDNGDDDGDDGADRDDRDDDRDDND